MPRPLLHLALSCLIAPCLLAQGTLSVKWEELTAPDFVKAIEKSQGTCLLPFGIVEKHGAHLPLGTDLFNIRRASLDAAAQEFVIVFPEYYFGQIFEARHQPGTIAYSASLQVQLLQETVDEMARNGCKKILIANGHGGNEYLLPYFAQTEMASPRDYVVYVYPLPDFDTRDRPSKISPVDMHAGETETSRTLISRPDLVHLDRANQGSGADLARLKDLPDPVYTGIWWYARFPEHYAGVGTARKDLGEFDMKAWSTALVRALRAIKADRQSLQLQNEFFQKAKDPLRTKQ